eukprot:gene1051-1185_t
MHKLESPHTLRFHDWYETRNNLWLILEYCTGADLEALLKQDGHLPETSVRSFGVDILAGLKVKPIVCNKAIEPIERPSFKPEHLPCHPLTHEAASRLSATDLQAHLSLIYRALSRTMAISVPNPVPGSVTGTAPAPPGTLSAMSVDMRNSLLAYLGALAPAAEVANTILNTNFLILVLRTIRMPAQSPAPTPTPLAGNRATSRALPTSSSRALATSTLAMMLRYANFIQPPSVRNREEHIIPTLVGVLKETGRVDLKLRKRAIAALGEILFYISAQDEDPTSDTGSAEEKAARGGGVGAAPATEAKTKWLVPDTAFTAILKALRDDPDEVVRHYAAKVGDIVVEVNTTENILAQGSLSHRRRLSSLETALRLLELAHSSRNEAMQITCGAALSHLLAHVLSCGSPSSPAVPESPAATPNVIGLHSNSPGRISRPTSAVTNTPSPTGAKLVARVFDKGGLQSVLDTLRDGPPRLQQSYLNVLNMIFSGPVTILAPADRRADKFLEGVTSAVSNAGSNMSYLLTRAKNASEQHVAEVESSLRSHRQFICKNQYVLPTLLRLIEQGGTDLVRAKALLAAQLLCRYQSSFLPVLGEKRLPSVLVRLLEQPMSAIGGRLSVSQNGLALTSKLRSSPLSYLSKCAMSMLIFVKTLLLENSLLVTAELQKLDAEFASTGLPSEGVTNHRASVTPLLTITGAPSRAAGGRRQLSSYLPGVQVGDGLRETARADCEQLSNAASSLRGAMSLVTLPALRRMGVSEMFIVVFSDTLDALWAVRKLTKGGVGEEDGGGMDGGVLGGGNGPGGRDRLAEIASALLAVEEALFVCLETVSQVDIHDQSGAVTSEKGDKGSPSSGVAITLMSKLIPVTAVFADHSDSNVRVLVAAVLRRLTPTLVSYSVTAEQAADRKQQPGHGLIGNDGEDDSVDRLVAAREVCLRAVSRQAPTLLSDQ